MPFKFERLDVWQLALDYDDLMCELVDQLPDNERFHLKSQIKSASMSIALNIAEGSTGQTDPEQNRFLGMALRSLIETVACQRLAARRKYVTDRAYWEHLDLKAQEFARRLQAFRNALSGSSQNRSAREDQALYDTNEI
jgi:four helix bundle protein